MRTGMEGDIRVLHVPSVNLYVMRYSGAGEVTAERTAHGQRQPLRAQQWHERTTPEWRAPIYYSDILGAFMAKKGPTKDRLQGDGCHRVCFPNGRTWVFMSCIWRRPAGKLIGIMGGSGSGKSTLLNILNGNLKPSRGHVTINGIDVHSERDRIRGVIGHVSQDDLLIEELTVFQNLFYNAKLCFRRPDDEQVAERVLRMLQSLGLYETKDLKVGSPLEKTISGGQRKRLNIALELIREPSVLFVDEPTSGLSSRDSENIMDLLKELAP
jgi:ABC-type lipoprotein export system ATPase subunit